MGTAQETATSSLDDKLPQEILAGNIRYRPGCDGQWPDQLSIPFRNEVAEMEAKAIAYDLAWVLSECLEQDQRVVEDKGQFGPKFLIESGDVSCSQSYSITTGLGDESKGEGGIVYIEREKQCLHPPGIVGSYRPTKPLEKLARKAKKYHGNAGIIEKPWSLGSRAWNISVTMTQFAAFGGAMAALKNTYSGDAPLWIGLPIAVGWAYAFFDGIYRVMDNIPLWRANEVLEKEKKREKKKKSLAAASNNRASKD